jgi:hypothetical protein
MIRLETKDDFERARESLRRRDADELAMFLLSLAGRSGPVGEQIRTFIGGEDVAATVDSLRKRIGAIERASEYDHRHSLGREVGIQLGMIVDSVEQLLLIRDPRSAFDVLVSLFEADAVAMESCGEHDWHVESAYKRAAEVMAAAARHIPRAEIEDRIKALLQADGYAVRSVLKSVLRDGHMDRRDTK